MAKVWRILEPDLYNELMDIYKQRVMDNIRTNDVHTAGEVQVRVTVPESDGACIQPIARDEFLTEPPQVIDTEHIIMDKKDSSQVNGVHHPVDEDSNNNYSGEWDSIHVIRDRAAEGGGRTKKGPKQPRRVHKAKGGKRKNKKVTVQRKHLFFTYTYISEHT